jgi:glycosyltransferase involved in cell wall biosynthesis
VSDHDKTLMGKMVSPSAITIVPTGVDVSAFRRTTAEVDPATVMFLGSMDWPANIDGVDFFVRDVWPLVTARVPGAVFKVVGRRPPARIQALASDSVQIIGGVESVTPYLHDATAFVVPLRIGGGTRLKIYEAMAAGCAIVSTRVGAEGLEYQAGRDILIEETSSAFADAVVSLLTDALRRRSIGDAAFETASRFDWSVVAEEFAHVLDQARHEPRGRR